MASWTTAEDKNFKRALVMYADQWDTPKKWEKVTTMVGGGKSTAGGESHFHVLEEDIYIINLIMFIYRITTPLQPPKSVVAGSTTTTTGGWCISRCGRVAECVVCLFEVSDREEVRLLPKCNHGFHLKCIDMWFLFHSNCPLCRSPVVASNYDVVVVEILTPCEVVMVVRETIVATATSMASKTVGSSKPDGMLVIEIPSSAMMERCCNSEILKRSFTQQIIGMWLSLSGSTFPDIVP